MTRTANALLFLALTAGLGAQTAEPAPEPETTEAEEVSAAPAAERTAINLLGQTAADQGESRRNENVQFNLVDNNALKELNLRLGTTATIVEEFVVEQGYFGAEYGAPPVRPIHATPGVGGGVHGNLFQTHNNSVFNARAFFQVGDVQPARENLYGGAVVLPLWRKAFLNVNGSQNKIRGNVNGNVLIPLPGERTPLTNDPELRPIVQRLIDAFPDVPPNRQDIAERALNANAIQRINTDSANVQLDQGVGARNTLVLRYGFTGQSVDAFQFITGQNPDTDTKNHSGRLTWSKAWSPRTVAQTTLGFDRLGSLLVPAAGAAGPAQFGDAITGLGPSPIIPIDRAQNRFRYAALLRHTAGSHLLTAGFSLARLQYNGEETDGHRGILNFRDDFGRDAITNMRMGTPSELIQALGTTHRGFRNWETSFYLADRWQASANLTLSMGLRYEPWTRPHDVTGRSDLPFSSDLNNWAPQFGFAYRLPESWGVFRAAYGVQYGLVFPVTYGQDRLNAPHSLRIVVNAPNLADPLGGIRFEDLDPGGRTSRIELSPDIVTPYSHQYNASWEFEPARDWRVQLGYVGSRSHKLIITDFLNRAQVVEGLPLVSGTINDRRPEQNRFEHLFIHNGSRSYFDAGRVSLITPRWRGLTVNASYWFSKALDLGGDYTNTASGPDARVAVAQTQGESHSDLKARSNFDQPQAFLLQASYDLPGSGQKHLAGRLFGGWNFSAVALLKSGTPFTVESGSDAPGFGNVDGSRGDRPMLLDPAVLGRTIGNPDTSEALLPRPAFRFIRAPAELAGNLGRNTFRKGRIANINAALARTWPLGGDWRLTFRAESINFFNTPQFAEPTRQLTSPSFAQINNTLNDGRAFRFTLRFDF